MLEPLSKDFEIVNFIIRKFFNSSHCLDLEPQKFQEISWDKQEEFLNATMRNPLIKSYPVKIDFLRLFLKKLIQNLEPYHEVHDDLYTWLCIAMESNNNEQFSYRHYIVGNDLNNIISIKETNNMVVNGTTGMRTWEAAIMLSDWALCNVEVFKDKKVVELGSGVGFTGITIAKYCQPRSIILSDCHEDVMNTIDKNIAINFSSWSRQNNADAILFKNENRTIGVMSLDWNDCEFPSDMCPDIIIGSDIIYDPMILDPLHKVISSFLKMNQELDIFIAGVIRNEDTLNMFLQRLDSSNLQYQKIHQPKNVFVDWEPAVKRYLLKINNKR